MEGGGGTVGGRDGEREREKGRGRRQEVGKKTELRRTTRAGASSFILTPSTIHQIPKWSSSLLSFTQLPIHLSLFLSPTVLCIIHALGVTSSVNTHPADSTTHTLPALSLCASHTHKLFMSTSLTVVGDTEDADSQSHVHLLCTG